jgi:hypothetical protein
MCHRAIRPLASTASPDRYWVALAQLAQVGTIRSFLPEGYESGVFQNDQFTLEKGSPCLTAQGQARDQHHPLRVPLIVTPLVGASGPVAAHSRSTIQSPGADERARSQITEIDARIIADGSVSVLC